ncbi:MAG TPA: flagellar export protein FliJ [bacterium]|nr:flagellar export protein FliJ [bacterium]
MRRFRFRLQPVLRLRSQYERLAQKELAAAMADVNTVDQQLRAAEQGLADCAEQAVRSDAVGWLARSLEDGLRRHKWRLARQLQNAERRLEAVRNDYTAKAREVKTLQRLRDQERATWQQERQRSEQAELDELALLTRGVGADVDVDRDGPGEVTW